MAATDITKSKLYQAPLGYDEQSAVFTKSRMFNIDLTSALGGAFSHPTLDVLVGEAIVGGYWVVVAALVGGTSFKIEMASGDDWTGAVTTFTRGETGRFTGPSGSSATVTNNTAGITASYAHTAATTVDVTIAGTFTAGKLLVVGEFINVTALEDQL